MKKLLVVALASTAAYGAWHWRSSHHQHHADSLVEDRIWLDHLPRNDRDTIHAFAVLSEEPVGIFQAVSQWKGEYEIFRYEHHGDELWMFFPQTGSNEKVTARARKCSEGGMDYCLELSGSSRGVTKYYSMEGWEIGSLRAAEDRTKQLTH